MANIIIDIVFVSFVAQTIYYYLRRTYGEEKDFPLTKENMKYIKLGYLMIFLYFVVMFIEYTTGDWRMLVIAIPILLYFLFVWGKLYGTPLGLIVRGFKFKTIDEVKKKK